MPVYNLFLLRQQLERHEGLRLLPYRDSLGHLTCGIGHLMTKPWTMPLVEAHYAEDVAEAEQALDQFMSWWRKLSDVRQRVLLDMCFNLGITKLLQFKLFLGFVRAGDYGHAADAMLKSLWAEQVKGRAVRLAAMMRSDRDQN